MSTALPHQRGPGLCDHLESALLRADDRAAKRVPAVVEGVVG